MASYAAPCGAVCCAAKLETPNPLVLRRVGCFSVGVALYAMVDQYH